jgi:hypothetical protein
MKNAEILKKIKDELDILHASLLIKKLINDYPEHVNCSKTITIYISLDVYNVLTRYSTLPFEIINYNFTPDNNLKNSEFAFTKPSELVDTIDMLYD